MPEKAALVLFALAVSLLLYAGIFSYLNFGYTSDGFYCFSSVRNAAFLNAFFYQGPIFRYIFGTHAYTIFLLLVPIVRLVPNPILFLLLQNLCHPASVLIFYAICRRLQTNSGTRTRFDRWLAIGFSCVYFLYEPAFAEMLCPYFMFQPDCLIEPIMLGAVLAFLRQNKILFITMVVALTLVKEEYLLYPGALVAALALLSWIRQERIHSWLWVFVIATVMGTAVGSGAFLVVSYFKRLNYATPDYIPSVFRFDAIGFINTLAHFYEDPALLEWVGTFSYPLAMPIACALILALSNKNWRHVGVSLSVFALMELLLIFRGSLTSAVYHEGMYYVHWSNSVLTPFILSSMALGLLPVIASHASKPWMRVAAMASVIACLALQTYRIHDSDPVARISAAMAGPTPFQNEHRAEVESLRQEIPISYDRYEYIAMPEYIVYPFMDRSHAPLGWLAQQDPGIRRRIIEGANYIILPKPNANDEVIKNMDVSRRLDVGRAMLQVSYDAMPKNSLQIVKETANYYLLKPQSVAQRQL